MGQERLCDLVRVNDLVSLMFSPFIQCADHFGASYQPEPVLLLSPQVFEITLRSFEGSTRVRGAGKPHRVSDICRARVRLHLSYRGFDAVCDGIGVGATHMRKGAGVEHIVLEFRALPDNDGVTGCRKLSPECLIARPSSLAALKQQNG